MATANRKAVIQGDIYTVWNIITEIEHYPTWRSDLSKAEAVNEKQFMEYTKEGYPTTFTITAVEPYQRWEFDMENSNMKGHWIGIFTPKGAETEINFTEHVIAKKFFIKPFVKSFLKKQQAQFIMDLQEALARYCVRGA